VKEEENRRRQSKKGKRKIRTLYGLKEKRRRNES
jgi:hypothetical protein